MNFDIYPGAPEFPVTPLYTCRRLVVGVIVTRVSTVTPLYTCLRLVGVILTRQAKRVADRAHLVRSLHHSAPQLAVARQVREVSDDVQADAGARQRHADPVLVADETDSRRFPLADVAAAAAAAASHDRQQDDVVLFALVVVDRTQPDIAQRRALAKLSTHEKHLTRVRSQDCHLHIVATSRVIHSNISQY